MQETLYQRTMANGPVGFVSRGPVSDGPMDARPAGVSQHLESAGNNTIRAHELADMLLQHIGGPVPKDEVNTAGVACLISIAARHVDETASLCKKLETVLQMLGR